MTRKARRYTKKGAARRVAVRTGQTRKRKKRYTTGSKFGDVWI